MMQQGTAAYGRPFLLFFSYWPQIAEYRKFLLKCPERLTFK
jgi:hypothetical protein